jgi:hypothetical protein
VKLLIAVMLVTGCSEPPVEEPPATPAMTLEPGNATGQEVVLQPGAQGGFHVWMSFRVADMSPGRVSLARRAHRVSDGKSVLDLLQPVDLESAGGQVGGGPVPMFMCPSPIGLSVIDAPIVFELRVIESGVEKARGEITLTPRCPSDSQREFCERICTG